MKIEETKISLNEIRIYAFHGVDKQENIVGNNYIVNIVLDTDFSRAAFEDNLEGTVNYAEVYETVKKEMIIPSRLIEHVAFRIARSILEKFAGVSRVSVSLAKENPPMGADISSTEVKITVAR